MSSYQSFLWIYRCKWRIHFSYKITKNPSIFVYNWTQQYRTPFQFDEFFGQKFSLFWFCDFAIFLIKIKEDIPESRIFHLVSDFIFSWITWWIFTFLKALQLRRFWLGNFSLSLLCFWPSIYALTGNFSNSINCALLIIELNEKKN